MAQGFRYGQVGIVELDIFSHQADGHTAAAAADIFHHLFPVCQIRLPGFQSQFPAHDGRQIRLFQHQRRFIQHRKGDVFNDAVRLYVAEQADFLENGRLQGFVTAQNNNVGVNAHTPQFLDGMLGGFGFVLVRAPEERHQGHMDEQAVLPAHFQGNLPHCFQEGLGLDVTDGTPDFRNHHIGIGLLSHPVDKILDFVGNMGNHLDSRAQILSPTLLIQHIPVNLAGGQVGILVQIFVDKPLIVAQIQIRLRTVLGNVDLSVLIRAHGTRVDVDIRVQLLGGNFQPPGLQQPAQGGSRNALAQTGNHAAGYKDIFRHMPVFSFSHSTVTDLARFFGLSMSHPFSFAT